MYGGPCWEFGGEYENRRQEFVSNLWSWAVGEGRERCGESDRV